MSTLSKSEHKACLSTSSSPQCPSISQHLPRRDHHDEHNVQQQTLRPRAPTRSHTTPAINKTNRQSNGSFGADGDGAAQKRVDFVLVLCYMLVYCEVAWLIMILLRSNSRH